MNRLFPFLISTVLCSAANGQGFDPVSTHILDTTNGLSGPGVPVTLLKYSEAERQWDELLQL